MGWTAGVLRLSVVGHKTVACRCEAQHLDGNACGYTLALVRRWPLGVHQVQQPRWDAYQYGQATCRLQLHAAVNDNVYRT